MTDIFSYCHKFRFDKPIRMATDNVMGYMVEPEFSPTPPPPEGYFLLLQGGPFKLLNETLAPNNNMGLL